jgi:hypothetical protein
MPIMQPGSKRRTVKAEAMAFLSHALSGGAVPATEVGRRAREHNLTAKPLRLAREALGVKIVRHGFGPGSQSVWSLSGRHTDAHLSPQQRAHRKSPREGMKLSGWTLAASVTTATGMPVRLGRNPARSIWSAIRLPPTLSNRCTKTAGSTGTTGLATFPRKFATAC